MSIDRDRYQGGLDVAQKRVKFCLDQLEKYGFKKGMDWDSTIAHNLTLEEVVGALVAAEQEISDVDLEE